MVNELGAVSSTLASLKAALDLTKAFLDVKGAVDVQGKVFELQRVILSAQQDALTAQQAQAALIEEKRSLEAKLVQLEAWDTEKNRYHLQRLPGFNKVLAYALKDDAEPPEEPHWICPTCYHRGQKRVLQLEARQGRCDVYACHECGTDLYATGHPHENQPRRGGRR